LDAAVLRAVGGLEFVRQRAALVDQAVRAFTEAAPGSNDGAVAVLAVGGYGRLELFPGSDVDLVVLHEESSHRIAERVAEAVLYPLWDLGVPTGNAVRTVAECDAAGAADPRALTALMDARLVAGSADLLADLNVAMDRGSLSDPARFLQALDGTRDERLRRFGRLAHTAEPDLKEALGGLRDVAIPAWLARAGLPPPSAPQALSDAADLLRRARAMLQLSTGARSNRL
jgi:[protein-PII] uridylyltransferase